MALFLLEHKHYWRYAMGKAWFLRKSNGSDWSRSEIETLVYAKIEIETCVTKPDMLVATNQPPNGQTFEEVLGLGVNMKEVDITSIEYEDRWWS